MIQLIGENDPKKRIIIKNVVGKVRTTFTIPEKDYVFGIPNKIDTEGAGRVLEQWVQSEPSRPEASMRDLPATNREALRNGCLTAKEYAEFIKRSPVYKVNPKSNNSSKKQPLPSEILSEDRTFGIKSLTNNVSIANLLQGNPAIEEAGEYIPHVQKKGRLPPAKATKSSQLLHKVTLLNTGSEQELKIPFKMKRFLNVAPKVDTIRIRTC